MVAKRQRLYATLVAAGVIGLSAGAVWAASYRDGGDPAQKERVIWQDSFDHYSQWSYNNNQIWYGGPTPPGYPTGTYPSKGDPCAVTNQTVPGAYDLARQQWLSNNCPTITTPIGDSAYASSFEAHVDPGWCVGSGQVCTTSAMFGKMNSVWNYGSFTSMGMFTHHLYAQRIQNFQLRAWDTPNPTAVNGDDDHPLTFIFYLHDGGASGNQRCLYDNSFVELGLGDAHAPTDYVWRGNNYGEEGCPADPADPECCPQGPYPVICQQAREVNIGNDHEDAASLQWLNENCPALVSPFDPQTGTGKTWSAIAVGFLAIMDTNPCAYGIETAHRPAKNHLALFDGNKWRELRSGRGTALTQCPPPWTTDPVTDYSGYEIAMADDGAGMCGNFSLSYGDHKVYMKLTSSKILLYMKGGDNTDYCGAFPRIYTGPFDKISMGVSPGCELDSTSYTCKSGGTPTQCLTYSDTGEAGWDRTQVDSMNLFDGVLVQSTTTGACCKPDGECLDDVTLAECQLENGVYHGDGSTCAQFLCCPTPFADSDGDGDVDQDDFGALQVCFTGTNGGVPTGCECFDRVGVPSAGIDASDFTEFSNCWTGANVLYSVALPSGCNP